MRQSLPYLREMGWEPTVLAVAPEYCAAPEDPWLVQTVPEDVRVERVRALPLEATSRLGLGSLDVRAFPFLARAGSRLLATGAFDLVYFSTTAFSLMPLGRYWQRRFGVPFVLDIQDPWLSDYYERPGAPEPPGGRFKYSLSKQLARFLEPWTIPSAAHIITVSPSYPVQLRQRYPEVEPERFTVLPFGAPNNDFAALEASPVAQRVFDPGDGRQHWAYVGAAGPIMEFSLRALFLALRAWRDAAPEVVERLVLHFVGTDYAPGARARKSVQPIADACGVGDLVEELPRRISYAEALQCLLDADALLMPGSDSAGYTASKLYPYVLAEKPLLAVFHEESSVVSILRATRAGVVVPFGPADTAEGVAGRIRTAWMESGAWAERPATDWAAFEPYTAREMTRRQVEVFDRVVAEREGARPSVSAG